MHRERMADLRRLLRRLGAVVFRRAASSTLHFLEVDGPCPERMGLSSATLTGDAYSFWTRVDAEDRRRVLETLEEAIRKGGEYRVAYRLHDPGGRVYAIREEGVAVVEPDGTVEELCGLILDGTSDLPDGERALACQDPDRERFEALAANSGEMIAEISPRGALSFASPRLYEELGHRAPDLLDSDPISLVHPEDREDVLATCREALRTGEPAEVLCRLARADGSWLWAELGGRSYTNAAGALQGVVTGRNVENRVRIEEAFLAQRVGEARIGKLCRRFLELGSEGLDDALQEGVEAAAAIAGVDRCYLVAFRGVGADEPRAWTWQKEGFEEWDPQRLADRSAERNRWMRESLMRGEVIRVPRVSELAEEHAAAREHWRARGIQSYLVIPVRSKGRVSALLGFQSIHCERDWTEQELALLRLVAELFSSALYRREVEGELLDGEQRLRALIDGAQDAICENELERGEIVYANPRFFEILGYTPEEAEGMSAFEFMHPDDLAEMKRVHRAHARGELGDIVSGTLLYRGVHKDGSLRWLEANGRIFRTTRGEPRSTAVIRDVTAREEAQKEMERHLENQNRVANLARDLLSQGVDEIDAGVSQGLVSLLPISRADRSWLVARGREVDADQEEWEWHGDGLPVPGISMDRVALESHPYARSHFREGRSLVLPDASLADDSPEMDFLRERGSASLLAIPILSGRRIVGVIGFERIQDESGWSADTEALLRLTGEVLVSAISRRSAEAQLRDSRGQLLQSQKMEAVGTLAGGVAHDFNNQLSVILGNARFVMKEVEEDADLREALADLERAAEHCAQLTRSLLSFSRNTPAEAHALPVSKVLRDLRELTRPMVPRSIDFAVAAHDEADAVLADRTQLQQVLVNLVVNACDAMPEGGRLSISTERCTLDETEAERAGVSTAGDYVHFRVSDTGLGMDDDILARIFEPFFTTKEPGRGTGLGLATAYGILRESRGAIWAESQRGAGTTFHLLLPRVGGAETGPDAPDRSVRGDETVLLVESDDSVRRMLRSMLGRVGFRVLEAAGGAAALALAGEHDGDIDVLVSEIAIPDVGGVELATRLREARPALRVLLTTSQHEVEVELPGARLLAKPFLQGDLVLALESLLGGRRGEPDRP